MIRRRRRVGGGTGAPGGSRRLRWLLVLAAPLLVDALPLRAQVIQGRVLSSPADLPIPQASVNVVDSLGVVLLSGLSSPSGVFRIDVGGVGGPVYLQAQALGFLTFFDGPIPLQGVEPVDLVVRLQPRPFSMDSLTVTVERQSIWLDYSGFYDREASGFGHHIDRDRIESRPWAHTLGDLLRTIPGVSVDNVGGVRLRGMGTLGRDGQSGGCPYSVYLDGAMVVSPMMPDDGWARSLIRPEDVDGIEVYRRPSEVPVQYSAYGGCGVILIWSRR